MSRPQENEQTPDPATGEIFLAFLYPGLSAFGGPAMGKIHHL